MICLADAGPAGTISGMDSWHPHRRRHALRRGLPIAAGTLLCYLGSYAAFSSWGQYVAAPAETTAASTPSPATEWAPGEFYDFSTRRWRKSHTLVYAPLLWIDQRWWHPPPDPRPDPAAP